MSETTNLVSIADLNSYTLKGLENLGGQMQVKIKELYYIGKFREWIMKEIGNMEKIKNDKIKAGAATEDCIKCGRVKDTISQVEIQKITDEITQMEKEITYDISNLPKYTFEELDKLTPIAGKNKLDGNDILGIMFLIIEE